MTGPPDAVGDAAVHRVECPVEWPPGQTAAYVVEGSETLLVDAGMPGDAESAFRDGLADAGFDPADVDVAVVTHPHRDHAGQVPTVLDANPGVTLCAPAGVRDRLARDPDALEAATRRNARLAGCTDEEVEFLADHAVEGLRRKRRLLPPDRVDRWLGYGATVDLAGVDVDVVHTPGHQAEHCCYRADLGGDSVLFSGDMAMEPFRPVAIHTGRDEGIGDAVPAFYRALDRLAALDVDRVYPGHGDVHAGFEDAVERDRESLDRLLDSVRDLLASGHGTARDIAEIRTGDRAIRYMLPEVVAALRHLHDRGEAVREERAGARHYDLA